MKREYVERKLSSADRDFTTYHHTGINFTCLRLSNYLLSPVFAVLMSGYPDDHKNQRSVLAALHLIGISQSGRVLTDDCR